MNSENTTQLNLMITAHSRNGYSESPVTGRRVIVLASPANAGGNHLFTQPNAFSMQVFRGTGKRYYLSQTGFYQTNPVSLIQSAGEFFYGNTSLTPTGNVDFQITLDAALGKIFDQMRGNSNLAVDLAERHQTLKLLKNGLSLRKIVAGFVQEMIQSPKFNRLPPGKRRLKYVNNKWLEYRYGWMPLFHSIYDTISTLGREVDRGVYWVKARSSRTLNVKDRVGEGSFTNPYVTTHTITKYRTELKLRFERPQGNQIYDFTSLNPLKIAWELTPYSFVADWFVNVSKVLDLWENYFIYGSSFRGGYQTNSYIEYVDVSTDGSSYFPVLYWPNGQPVDGNYSNSVSSGYLSKRLSLVRMVLSELPLPSIVPRVEVNLNAKRVADSAALLSNVLFPLKMKILKH